MPLLRKPWEMSCSERIAFGPGRGQPRPGPATFLLLGSTPLARVTGLMATCARPRDFFHFTEADVSADRHRTKEVSSVGVPGHSPVAMPSDVSA